MLARILYDDRVSRQLDPRAAKETDQIISAMLPQLRAVPTEYLYECYVLALENRSEGNTYPMTGGELLMAWHVKERQLADERVEEGKLLPEYAAGACGRCYKRKDDKGRIIECLEISLVDGSLLGPCDHRPLTDEEKAEAARQKTDFLTAMRADARRKHEAKLKAEAAKPKEANLVGAELECVNCHRTVNTLAGWTEGEQCGIKLDRESAICPQCESSVGVPSFGKMVCRECFHVYEVVLKLAPSETERIAGRDYPETFGFEKQGCSCLTGEVVSEKYVRDEEADRLALEKM